MKKLNPILAPASTGRLGAVFVALCALGFTPGCKKDAQDEVEKAAQALAAEPSAAVEQAQEQIEAAKAQAEQAEKAAQEAAAQASAAAGADSAAGANLGQGDEVALAPTTSAPTPPPAAPPPAAPRPPREEERRGLAPTPPRPAPTPPPATPPKPEPDEGSSGDGKRTFKKRIGVSKKRLPGQEN